MKKKSISTLACLFLTLSMILAQGSKEPGTIYLKNGDEIKFINIESMDGFLNTTAQVDLTTDTELIVYHNQVKRPIKFSLIKQITISAYKERYYNPATFVIDLRNGKQAVVSYRGIINLYFDVIDELTEEIMEQSFSSKIPSIEKIVFDD